MQIQIVNFDNTNGKHIHSIRNEVFINEQGIDPQIEYDGLDNSAIHTLIFIKDKAVGTGRILKDGHIGRVAVLKKYRGQNIGSKIITSLIGVAMKNHYNRVYLSAQKQAINFYFKLGFTPFGNEFIEANILHQSMEKILD